MPWAMRLNLHRRHNVTAGVEGEVRCGEGWCARSSETEKTEVTEEGKKKLVLSVEAGKEFSSYSFFSQN